MAFTTSIRTSGGGKLEAVLKKAEQARAKQIKVGFFSDKKYDDKDETPVALVAALNEFGLGTGTPERPFFRQSIAIIEDGLPKQLAKVLDPTTMDVSVADARRIGEYAKGVIQGRIQDLKDPPNTPATIRQKGSSSPLVDTGQMHDAVDFEVM